MDLLSYCARAWRGETPRARLMRKVRLSGEGEAGCRAHEAHTHAALRCQRSTETEGAARGHVARTEKPSSRETPIPGLSLRASAFEDVGTVL